MMQLMLLCQITALNSLVANTTGSANTALGNFALNANTTGADGTAVGGAAQPAG